MASLLDSGSSELTTWVPEVSRDAGLRRAGAVGIGLHLRGRPRRRSPGWPAAELRRQIILLELAAAAVAVVVEPGMLGRQVLGVDVPLHHVGDDRQVELEDRDLARPCRGRSLPEARRGRRRGHSGNSVSLTSWSGSVAVITIRPARGERLEEEAARGGRDPEDLLARLEPLEQPGELPLVQVRAGDVQVGMPAVVVAVPQDDHPERVLRPEPLPQLVDVGGDPLAVRQPSCPASAGPSPGWLATPNRTRTSRGGEAATLRQRLVQLLDRRREELAVIVVPRQAADDQGTPGPDGPLAPRPRSRFVRGPARRPQASRRRQTRASAPGRREARHHPPCPSTREVLAAYGLMDLIAIPVTKQVE